MPGSSRLLSAPHTMAQGDDLLREAITLYLSRVDKWSTEEKTQLAAIFKEYIATVYLFEYWTIITGGPPRVRLARNRALKQEGLAQFGSRLVDIFIYMSTSQAGYAKVHRLANVLSVGGALNVIENMSSDNNEDALDTEMEMRASTLSNIARLLRVTPYITIFQALSPIHYVNQGDKYLQEAVTMYARQSGWSTHEKALLASVFKATKESRAQTEGSQLSNLEKIPFSRAYVNQAKRAYELVKLLTPKLALDEALSTMDAITAIGGDATSE
ncbi:hypothetical protein OF83DRAFT_1145709 [Amylostereum chailletii]|nr:hypothetical protein OF83DRAFT_1145709 [Amylostereum chailletii]